MGLKLITPPASSVLTIDEAKAHLRVIGSDDDSIISAVERAATSNVENWTGRALIDQTWDLYLDEFPTDDLEIMIPKPPLIEIVSVNYADTNGVDQSISSSDYYVDNVSEPGWIVPAADLLLAWPTTIDAINSVRIRFRAGYLNANSPADNGVPEDIKAAVKLLMGTMYEHRENQVVGTIANKLPWGVENLLRPHRVLLGMS